MVKAQASVGYHNDRARWTLQTFSKSSSRLRLQDSERLSLVFGQYGEVTEEDGEGAS